MLTDITVRQAKATGKPYTIADFDGLSLFVAANGANTWHFFATPGSAGASASPWAAPQRNGIRPANVLSHAALFDQACEVGCVDSGQRVSRHDHLFDAS